MKSLIVFVYILVHGYYGLSQFVTIPDPQFKSFLLNSFDSNGDLAISEAEALIPTVMNCQGQGIADLTGIQAFENVTDLNCSLNRLKSLPDLPLNLSVLDLSRNLLDRSSCHEVVGLINSGVAVSYAPQLTYISLESELELWPSTPSILYGWVSKVTDGKFICAYDFCEELVLLEEEIQTDLNQYQTTTDFTLMIETENGDSFLHSTGASSETVSYRSASTSKWVTATAILSLVDSGALSLEDYPQNYIPFWPVTGNLSQIKLKHLLSFTSGLSNAPFCLNIGGSDFSACVAEIIDDNNQSLPPGADFFYSSAHLQVAGLMAMNAAGFATWEALFESFKATTGLFPDSMYDLPSLGNPRLAGGMHWTAEEYHAFLAAFYHSELLTPELMDLMTQDQLGSASIGYSPSVTGVGEDWHYGFGLWIECHAALYNCEITTRISSPGAYGAYPFIDYGHKYFGILGREGSLGTFDEGYTLFSFISNKLETWAGMGCD